jgi:hypothetical protein
VKNNDIISDHLSNWSGIYERQNNSQSQAKTKNTPEKTSSFRSCPQGFFNRTLQALWKARVKVCAWARAWSKILFISQQAWKESPDGLHPAGSTGKGRTIPRELSQYKSYPGRALRDKSRAFETQGEILARAPPSLRGHCDGRISG